MSVQPSRPRTSRQPSRLTGSRHVQGSSSLQDVSRSLFSKERAGEGSSKAAASASSSVRTRKGSVAIGGDPSSSSLSTPGVISGIGTGVVSLPIVSVVPGGVSVGTRGGKGHGAADNRKRYNIWHAIYLTLFLGDFRGDLVELATLVSERNPVHCPVHLFSNCVLDFLVCAGHRRVRHRSFAATQEMDEIPHCHLLTSHGPYYMSLIFSSCVYCIL